MWRAIIRPPRDQYTVEQLGPPEFYYKERRYKRRDFELVNARGLTMKCSHFEPVKRNGQHEISPRPCVVYLHGNCSSRLEAVHCGCLRVLLPLDISVLCFDFTGSGQSDGEYVSLGWFEREDLKQIVSYLRDLGRVSTIGLWGRSMGAVTACMFVDQDPSIAGLVIDSPFMSLRQLAEELAGDFVGWKVPKIIINPALNLVRNTIITKAKFDLDDLELLKHCKASFAPALFIAAKDDSFIRPHHARTLHDVYAGDKNFILVEGNHNTARPEFLHDSVTIFFKFSLRLVGGPEYPYVGSSSLLNHIATSLARLEHNRRDRIHHKLGKKFHLKDINSTRTNKSFNSLQSISQKPDESSTDNTKITSIQTVFPIVDSHNVTSFNEKPLSLDNRTRSKTMTNPSSVPAEKQIWSNSLLNNTVEIPTNHSYILSAEALTTHPSEPSTITFEDKEIDLTGIQDAELEELIEEFAFTVGSHSIDYPITPSVQPSPISLNVEHSYCSLSPWGGCSYTPIGLDSTLSGNSSSCSSGTSSSSMNQSEGHLLLTPSSHTTDANNLEPIQRVTGGWFSSRFRMRPPDNDTSSPKGTIDDYILFKDA